MLYSRPLLSILLLLASALQGAVVYAQNDEPTGSERQRKRLGDSPVQVERELDLAVPSGEEKSSDSPSEEQLTQQQLIDRQLAAATAALQAGRVDQPPNDCAWSHYRKVLDIDPENEEALQGLTVVQEVMVSRAVEAAKNLDFESAERILEDAALVRESEDSMDGVHQQILAVRDCWQDSYFQAPVDGSARLSPDCELRIVRGGHWASSPDQTRSAHRLSAQPDLRDAQIGFRIARDL